MGSPRDGFAAVVAAGERADLARGALEIARIGHPDLDPAPSLARLDTLAAGARPHLTDGMPPEEAAAALAGYLFGACGFRGNQDDYYDPRNSFLNDVLERRTGIPISLGIVLLETGTRLGLQLDGVGFPGHFLVRVAGSAGPIFLDPFFGGRKVDEDELLSRYHAFLGPRTPVQERVPADALRATSTLGILARMLRNLLHVYLERDDPTHALHTVDLLLVLVPDAADAVRVRGLLYERLECAAAARDDLRRYLELAPGASDADDIRARLARLTRAASTLH
jgi:regulator of sirC expression with transglutaminase-like and TPR domain